MKDFKELKKKLRLSNADIAKMYGLNVSSYNNSTAKKKYENALLQFYNILNN